MSDLTEPSPNISALASLYPEGDFPSHIDVFGKGGFVVLNDQIGASAADDFINERVTYQRRKEGMLVYVSSNSSYYRCVVTGSSESEGEWTKQYFAGRYFHGATAPTATDIQLGEKWFDTVVGTEYTYIPIADGSTYLAWVDIDHLGQGQGETGFVRISGDTMIGTLTGTNASFTGLTATNGFIGTLTGNNIKYTNAEFGTDSLVIQGSSATFTDMSVMITGDSTFDINDLSIGTTFSANVLNQNVYRIFADDGVALGGNTLSKNNWLGNNVFLTPQEDYSVMIGFPTSTPVDDSYAKLVVTGGIITKRIFSIGPEYSGITAFQNGVNFENIASAAAFGITSVDGYEHPLLSVQDRQNGGWVNAPKIRRVWPSGSTGAKSRTDDFESNEYVTKSYVDNNTMLRDSGANPNGQKWRMISVGAAGLQGVDHAYNTGPYTYPIDGYRDLGFTGPMYIDVVLQLALTNSTTMTQQRVRVSSTVNFGSFDIIFSNFVSNPSPSERIKIDTATKQVKINTDSNVGYLSYINITPSS